MDGWTVWLGCCERGESAAMDMLRGARGCLDGDWKLEGEERGSIYEPRRWRARELSRSRTKKKRKKGHL